MGIREQGKEPNHGEQRSTWSELDEQEDRVVEKRQGDIHQYLAVILAVIPETGSLAFPTILSEKKKNHL